MRHDRVQLDAGGVMVFDCPRRHPMLCAICKKPATHCCDQVLNNDVVCARPVCADHVVRAHIDLCKQHAQFLGAQARQEVLDLGTGASA